MSALKSGGLIGINTPPAANVCHMTATPRRRANPESIVQASGGADQWTCLATQVGSLWIEAFQSNLQNWRSMSDAMTATVRAQQDLALQTLQSPVGAQANADTPDAPAQFLAPMLAARNVYHQMSAAIIEAPKHALHTLSENEQPH